MNLIQNKLNIYFVKYAEFKVFISQEAIQMDMESCPIVLIQTQLLKLFMLNLMVKIGRNLMTMQLLKTYLKIINFPKPILLLNLSMK